LELAIINFSHHEKIVVEKSEIKEYKVGRKNKIKVPYNESCQIYVYP
jgi:hypothetical protein